MFDEKMVARFWARVEKAGPDECWEWKQHLSNGIPIFSCDKLSKGGYSATRFMLELETGQIVPKDKSVIRVCDNKRCVNPRHLVVVRKGMTLAMWRAEQQSPPKRDRPPLYYLAWMAGFDLELLPNGRYRVVRRG